MPGASSFSRWAALPYLWNCSLVAAAFAGIKAAVLAIVVEALMRVSKRALHRGIDWAVAMAAFVALFRVRRSISAHRHCCGAARVRARDGRALLQACRAPSSHPCRSCKRQRRPGFGSSSGFCLWVLSRSSSARGMCSLSSDCCIPSSPSVTFGGAYAVLTYLAQTVSQTYGWLTPGEMADALGLAETTPGPLILVTEFVAVIAGARFGGEPALLMGVLAAVVALWATFAPCFLWIFAGAPYLERSPHRPAQRRSPHGDGLLSWV